MKEIIVLLRKLGFYSTYQGFYYLAHAVSLCMEDEDYLLAVTKQLYPKIGRAFHVPDYTVEHAIRSMIKTCWDKGPNEFWPIVAGCILTDKPSSSEVIDILVSYLKLHS